MSVLPHRMTLLPALVAATLRIGVILLSLGSTAAAEGVEPLLTPSAALALLADGRPWNGTRPDGGRVKMTFNKDGTGRFEGPITRPLHWAAQGEEVCLALGFPLGEKCVRFAGSAAALRAYEGGTLAFTLRR